MSVNARAALLMTLAMAGFAFEDALLKFLSSDLSIGQLLLLLGFGGMVAFGAWVALGPEGLRWRDLIHPGVLLRNLCEAVCGVFFLTAISIGDLAIASAILQALPLLMTLGAALILGEKVGWRRWASIGAGFLGVLMIVRPGTDAFQPGSVLALVAVLFLAVRDLVTRRLPASIGSGLLTASAFGSMSLAGAALVVVGGQPLIAPDPAQWGLMAASLIFGLFGYLTMVIATRIGEIGAIAPFRYSRLVFAIILGLLVFAERPDGWMLTGAAIIAVAGGYTMWREARLNRAARRIPAGSVARPG
ncbi:MAG: DMT family transporter [Paracoccus sp. (in: a-proteobacteria)]|jgi:drug/metabolite transporter (DMT)-like permease|uniref:DMT family transporter n=1 Tax=unclassified Paracoccus (in: a-proteobacteria) TaxID=2688777 RepID=UPI000C67439E|nr:MULTISPECIES: DMT family transporter [unclassified Paracoccus (in: a-proteobacteria)]MAN55372.1 EamA family transporter [Paracoccus sp. (in: a-proteobacteria)]MCS5602185.1 DMT family transporter [Paracoccus sp. (in: a-proteobacteria)]MDB2552271.1 DMT family transporter [Paracoccus sp. (in: a-proteobacteria)]|tara:strand:- start:1984 stop:2892 length:909 start_codon:yes stop_codon:yes gene_type:complete